MAPVAGFITTLSRCFLGAALCAALLQACSVTPEAKQPNTGGITRIEITSVESPTFGGKLFGVAGAYEKLRGKAYGELNPEDPRNAIITDLRLAPRNMRGNVEYSTDFYILKPINSSKGNKKLFVEVNNRGNKLFGPFNQSVGGNNPTTADDAGAGFLMNQGYTMAWSGWDPSAPIGNDNLNITVPTVKNPNGSSITGPAYEYIVFDNASSVSYALSYPTVSRDTFKAKLTRRSRLNDVPVLVPNAEWEFISDTSIRLLPVGTPFKQSAIYELSYDAKDPVLAGAGFAATRDFVSFLRNDTGDGLHKKNPLAGDIKRVLGFAISQPGRYMNDFIWLGFNEDLNQRRVFDGVVNWIAAGTGDALNFRFAQPGRTERNRQNHLYPEGIFPFAYATLSDPLTGKTDGRNVRCSKTNTCPKIMAVNSSNEYWVKAGSLVHTDLFGNDLRDPFNVRFYLLSGVEHTVAGAPPNSPGVCQQPRNPIDPNPALRALFVAMDQWVDGIAPPNSRVPKVSDGTAVFIRSPESSSGVGGQVPQTSLGWPTIPGVLYSGLATVRHNFNFGPRFSKGILDNNPPVATINVYPSFVSKVDADGNEVAGIRLPEVAAPVATFTGWAHRAVEFGGPDGCEQFGQIIPFKTTKLQRDAVADPRLSLFERYADHSAYVNAVTAATKELAAQRLLLPADAQRYISNAEANGTLKNKRTDN